MERYRTHGNRSGQVETMARMFAIAAGVGRTMTQRGAFIWILLGALGCATKTVAPPPENVRRIAVLPLKGPVDAGAGAMAVPPLTVADVVAAAARLQLAEKGFEVVNPISVELATKGRRPTSPETAAEIVANAHLDATAMDIDVLVWQPLNEGIGVMGGATGIMSREAVCGMLLPPAAAAAERVVGGQRYVFCSLACAERFDAMPPATPSGGDAHV